MKRKSKLLRNQTTDTWVMIYGACTKVGKLTAKNFAKFNYKLILVDSNIAKLQKLKGELEQIFPTLRDIRLIQLDFTTQRDSTAIEHQLHRAIFQRDPWSALPEDPKFEAENESDTGLETTE